MINFLRSISTSCPKLAKEDDEDGQDDEAAGVVFFFGQDDATFSAGVTFPRHNVMFLCRRNCCHVRMAEAGTGNPVPLQRAAPYCGMTYRLFQVLYFADVKL